MLCRKGGLLGVDARSLARPAHAHQLDSTWMRVVGEIERVGLLGLQTCLDWIGHPRGTSTSRCLTALQPLEDSWHLNHELGSQAPQLGGPCVDFARAKGRVVHVELLATAAPTPLLGLPAPPLGGQYAFFLFSSSWRFFGTCTGAAIT